MTWLKRPRTATPLGPPRRLVYSSARAICSARTAANSSSAAVNAPPRLLSTWMTAIGAPARTTGTASTDRVW